MKPMIIVPTGLLNQTNLKLLRDNGICVVEAKDPAKVKWIDPIPASQNRDRMEMAAIKLSRILLSGGWASYYNENLLGRSAFARIFVDCLSEGTSLDPRGTIEEQEEQFITMARRQELEKIGREEARARRQRSASVVKRLQRPC